MVQTDLMKERKPTLLRHPIIRVLIVWIFQVIALVLLSWLSLGLLIDGVGAAIVAAALIGLLNAFLWPILTYILLPVAVLTLGVLALVLNGVIIMLVGALVPGFEVQGLGTAILVTIGMTAINLILSTLLTIDDDGPWHRNVVLRRMKQGAKPEETDVPGVLFLEIDGLAEPVLERAIEAGYAPNMARWLNEGTHRLVGWETDLSSQTSASQAGILHGNNWNMPAFRWYDRARKKVIASSNPDDVAEIEKRLSDGNGLLANGGASRGNLLSGDAPRVMVTASTIKDLSRLHAGDFYAYFASPYNFARTLVLFVWDIVLETYQFWRARLKDISPRLDLHKRGGTYPLLRAFTTVLMRELNINTLVGDMFAGVPVAYATFVGYDEVAHHSGVESSDAFDILYKLDQQFARLERAARFAPQPYHLVVLSDHGQSGGPTFKQRYHVTLQELIQQLAAQYRVQGAMEADESWGHVNVFLNDAIQHDRQSVARPLGRALNKRRVDGHVVLGPEGRATQAEQPETEASEADIVVLASGNLGLVYRADLKRRVTLEEIESFYPGLIEGLANHEGIGFLMIHSEARGGVVIGGKGRYYLEGDQVEGDNPLAPFGPHAADHLRRTDSFPDAPDVLINSLYNVETNEVAAFEELIGCHGGLGGYQTRPFILYPAEWQLETDEIVGAAAVYKQLKAWLETLDGRPPLKT